MGITRDDVEKLKSALTDLPENAHASVGVEALLRELAPLLAEASAKGYTPSDVRDRLFTVVPNLKNGLRLSDIKRAMGGSETTNPTPKPKKRSRDVAA